MYYTTQGAMTADDIAEIRRDMDLDICGCCEAGPITLAELARELGAQPYEVAAFGDLGDVPDDYYLSTEDAHEIREAWERAEPEPRECRRDQYGTCRDRHAGECN